MAAADVRVKIGSVAYSIPEAVVSVGWDTVLAFDRDGDSVNFDLSPKSEFVLSCRHLPLDWTGDEIDWDYLLDAATSCYDFEISIEQRCPKGTGTWSEVWAGTFNPKNWKVNYDRKTITFKVKETGELQCLKEAWNIEKNPHNLTTPVTMKANEFTYLTTEDEDLVGLGVPCPPGQGIFAPVGYCLDELIGEHTKCDYCYHSFRANGTCDGATPVPPNDFLTWTLLSGGCPGTPVYWTCPDSSRLVFEFRNGRRLDAVLDWLLDQTGCGLAIKSDFFGINGDATAPDNAAYDAALEYCQDLLIFQKSDIKRHDASDTSSSPSWGMKLKDLLEDLKTMFNLDWRVTDDGATLRIEHVSYFFSTAGADYTNEKYERILEYDRDKIPKYTRFQWRDKQCSPYFAGHPIEIYCGEGELERKLSMLSTDIPFIVDIDNAESIGDDGFVLAASYESAGKNYNLDNNRGLSWTQLHENFHRWEMPGAGKINNADTTPLSVKKTRKQPAFSVRHCCDDTFDPANYITTSLGNGDVESAEWNLARDILTVELKY